MIPLRRNLAPLALAVSLFALGVTGCSDDSEPDPPESGETNTSDQDGGCPILTEDAVTSALGETMVVSATGPQSCLFAPTDPESSASVTASVTKIDIDLQEYAEGTRGICDSEITDVEAGEAAFACVTFVGPQGFVFEGSSSVLLDVTSGDDSDPAAVEAAVAMLPSVTVP